jgi:hypothetical protein
MREDIIEYKKLQKRVNSFNKILLTQSIMLIVIIVCLYNAAISHDVMLSVSLAFSNLLILALGYITCNALDKAKKNLNNFLLTYFNKNTTVIMNDKRYFISCYVVLEEKQKNEITKHAFLLKSSGDEYPLVMNLNKLGKVVFNE